MAFPVSCAPQTEAPRSNFYKRKRSQDQDIDGEQLSEKTQRVFAASSCSLSPLDPEEKTDKIESMLYPVFLPSVDVPKIQYYALINGAPAMPRCGSKNLSEITDPFNRSALSIQQKGFYKWGLRKIPLDTSYDEGESPRTFPGGAHCLLSRIPMDQPPLIRGIDNKELIMETYLEQSIFSKDHRISVENGSAMRALHQYEQLQAAGIPVPILYNKDEAAQGCGYFMFEYISQTFQPSWNEGSNVTDNRELATIYYLFNFAALNQIHLNLTCKSLRKRLDGSIVFTGFNVNTPKQGKKLYFELEQGLRTFCRQGDRIYDQLHQAIAFLKKE